MSSGTDITVIVIGVDSPIGLSVVRDLGTHGVRVIGVGSNPHSVGRASRWTHSFFQRPKSPLIIDWLEPLIVAHRANAVLAISENDLIQLACLPEEIAGCRILTPRKGPLDLVLDKTRTLAIAAKLGMDVPQSWQPEKGEDFASVAAGLAYPVAVKWNDPMQVMPHLDAAGIAFEKVDYAQDATELLALLSRYDAIEAWPLVQTWCAGVGLGQMILMHRGKAALRFQHRRIHEWPPTGGVSSLCAVEPLADHAAQMAKSEKLLQTIDWHGPAMVEYRFDAATGRYWLMEINGRFWGSLPLALHSGACFAWETVRLSILSGAPDTVPPTFKALKACYAVPEFKRTLHLLGAPGPGLRARLKVLRQHAASFFDPNVRYYVWSWRDPLPFFADLRGMIGKVFAFIVSRRPRAGGGR